MDKLIEEIFKTINHITREVFIYLLSGFTVAINIFIIDFFYHQQSLYKLIIKYQYHQILCLVVLYVIGHVCSAFYYVLLELIKLGKGKKSIEARIKKCLKFNEDYNQDRLPEIYKKDNKTYIYFIERYDTLTLMRWNLSSALLINSITTFIYIIFSQKKWQIFFLTAIFFTTAIVMYLLSLKTEEDLINRIKSMQTDNEISQNTNKE